MTEIWVVEHSWYGTFGFTKRLDAIKAIALTTGLSVADVEQQVRENVGEVELVDADNTWHLFQIYCIYIETKPRAIGSYAKATK